MRLGAHVSTAGAPALAIERALEIGAETIQVFGSQPQMWRKRNYKPEDLAEFRQKAAAASVLPVFFHGIYLVNLATESPENLAKSEDALSHDLNLCPQFGSRGVIFHIGSHKGAGYASAFHQVVESIQRVLAKSPADVWLVLENSAGMGGSIGSKFSELGEIIREAGDGRVKVCLDTQHSFAAGYNVADKAGLEAVLAEFEREIGLANLVAVHANDSKVPLAGGRDRHENIGEGYIGREGFRTIMSHPAFRDVPFFLEVPGFENQGPDKRNLDILRQIREETGT